jgi:hypothetical protein
LAAIAAIASLATLWWVLGNDPTRSLGVISEIVVVDAPLVDGGPFTSDAVVTDDSGKVIRASLGYSCSSLSADWASPGQVWRETQSNGVRACRLDRTWRIADLVAHSEPGEPKASVAGGAVSIAFEPTPVHAEVGVVGFDVEITFPGEVLSHSGSSLVDGTTVLWNDPSDFFSGAGLSASGRDRPLPIQLLPLAAGLCALVSLAAAVSRRRVRPDAADVRSSANPMGTRPVPPGSRTAARPAGPDPRSPWRPPSP